MTNGMAIAIFRQLDDEKYTINEKGWAIHQVLSMPTTNGITKQEFKDALMWLWHQHFVMEDAFDVFGSDGGGA